MRKRKKPLRQRLKDRFRELDALDDDEAGAVAYHLGRLYESGIGGPVDYVQAVNWYMNSADCGDDWAMYKLGELYEHGYGLPPKKVKAAFWYVRAWEACGEAAGPAAYQLGMLERKRRRMSFYGRARWDFHTRSDWFWDSAAEGYEPAEEYTGFFFFLDLLDEIEEEWDEAAVEEWEARESVGRMERVAFSLAEKFAHGDGVAADADAAFFWYVFTLKAARLDRTDERARLAAQALALQYTAGKRLALLILDGEMAWALLRFGGYSRPGHWLLLQADRLLEEGKVCKTVEWLLWAYEEVTTRKGRAAVAHRLSALYRLGPKAIRDTVAADIWQQLARENGYDD